MNAKQVLSFSTKAGAFYNVYSNGAIERLDQPGTIYNDWLFLGIEHVRIRAFIPLSELLKGKIPERMTYLNGNPQWTVRDRDHGTMRTWGNTKHHGIRALSLVRN